MADDHAIYRDGLRAIFKKTPHITIVAEAKTGKELVELARIHLPDIVLADIKMPEMDGAEATFRLKDSHPEIKVIALSEYGEEPYVLRMLDAGAVGYLLKDILRDELLTAIEEVAEGNTYFSSAISSKMLHMLSKDKESIKRHFAKPGLTERELDIIQMTCEGKTHKEIGNTLNLSPRTVEGHRRRIMDKLDVTSIAGIIVYACKKGLF